MWKHHQKMYDTILHICWPIELRHDHVLVPLPNIVGRQTVQEILDYSYWEKMTGTCIWQQFQILIPNGSRVLTLYKDYNCSWQCYNESPLNILIFALAPYRGQLSLSNCITHNCTSIFHIDQRIRFTFSCLEKLRRNSDRMYF